MCELLLALSTALEMLLDVGVLHWWQPVVNKL
jgi:hypothetical protein